MAMRLMIQMGIIDVSSSMDYSGATAVAEPPPRNRLLSTQCDSGPAVEKNGQNDRRPVRPTAKDICGTIGLDAATPDDHKELMRRIATARDKAAFAALFGHFGPRVKAYLMRSGSPPDSAEELAQEAMVMVWRKAESFDPAQASVSTWIFTIARNKRIDAYRRMNRPELDETDPALVPDAPTAPDAAYAEGQVSAAIRRAVQTLPDEQAEMLKKAFYEDKAHSEIAAETGLPLGTVKSRLRLAIGRMRKQLKEFEE